MINMKNIFFNTTKTLLYSKKVIVTLAVVLLCILIPLQSQAQKITNKNIQPQIFEIKVHAADAITLIAEQTQITLWGIQAVEGQSASFNLKVRTTLENILSGKKIQCELKKKTATTIYAQCVNTKDIDLGLFMIQQGYVSVDRSVIYGTVFEEVYIHAEMEAQNRGVGIWAEESKEGNNSNTNSTLMLVFGFILFLCIIAAFILLSIIIMRGFQKVIDAQNDNIRMMGKERELRDKEREIVAVMLDSELKVNKSKIEAFLVVYEEMLKALKDSNREQKFKKSGDIIQKQPALERSVFERNTDKLDVLGLELSSNVIHFYARIKSKPEYETLEPDMSPEEAIKLVENVLSRARQLNKLADHLIDEFRDNGIGQS